MTLSREIRNRARHVVPSVLAICLVAYFAFHAVEGERGLLAHMSLEKQLVEARKIYAETSAERTALEQRVGLLDGSRLDIDMLDERVRVMLNYARPDELVIFVEPDGSSK